MPRSLTILQVLVASPNDVAEERDVVADAIEELNATWRKSGTIQLNLLRWETDTRPGLGTDAQAVINSQIADDYDIFIGIMGARFGTPTGRAESGTEEEFERAAARFKEDPQKVSVMFYFKDAPPTSLLDIDPVQLARVQRFQQRLQSSGLIRLFKTRDEFAKLMRMHLSLEVQEWAKRLETGDRITGESVGGGALDTAPLGSVADQEEEGFLDLIEEGTDAMEEFTRTIERIGAAVNEVGDRAVEQTAAMEEAKVSPEGIKAVKRASNQMASFMSEFVDRLEAEIPIYGAGFKRAVEPFIRAMSITEIRGDTPEQISTAIAAVEGLMTNQAEALGKYRDLRETIAGLPRITTAFNHARRRTVIALDRLMEEFEKSLRLGSELYDVLVKRRDSMK
jgi:hypothetical protein